MKEKLTRVLTTRMLHGNNRLSHQLKNLCDTENNGQQVKIKIEMTKTQSAQLEVEQIANEFGVTIPARLDIKIGL